MSCKCIDTGCSTGECMDFDSSLEMDLYFPHIITEDGGGGGSSMSGREILEKLKEVDGDGSGLDADTLDGKHADEFLTGADFPAGEVIVGTETGKPAGGGRFEDFERGFNREFNVQS